jgi:nucleoid-associated protein YgaU
MSMVGRFHELTMLWYVTMMKRLMLPIGVLLVGLALAWPFKKSPTKPASASLNQTTNSAQSPQPENFDASDAPPAMVVDMNRPDRPHRENRQETVNPVAARSVASSHQSAAVSLPQLPPQNLSAQTPLPHAVSAGEKSVLAVRKDSASAHIVGSPSPIRPGSGDSSMKTRVHTIRPGDTLPKIAIRYYGDPARWQDIYATNRDVLPHWDVLPIGAKLKLQVAQNQ